MLIHLEGKTGKFDIHGSWGHYSPAGRNQLGTPSPRWILGSAKGGTAGLAATASGTSKLASQDSTACLAAAWARVRPRDRGASEQPLDEDALQGNCWHTSLKNHGHTSRRLEDTLIVGIQVSCEIHGSSSGVRLAGKETHQNWPAMARGRRAFQVALLLNNYLHSILSFYFPSDKPLNQAGKLV